MSRTAITFLLTHKFVITLCLVGVAFLWLLVYVNRVTTISVDPARLSATDVETPIAPLNTKSFDTLKESLQSDTQSVRFDWSQIRDPFSPS